MKAAFDWEDNTKQQTCSWSLADWVRTDPNDATQWVAAVFSYDDHHNPSFMFQEHIEVYRASYTVRTTFVTLAEAKQCVDDILEKSGYKTLPLHMKVIV